jgi:aldose 1-epimerase
MTDAWGTEYELSLWDGGRSVRATISDVGAAIRQLSVGTVELCPGVHAVEAAPFYCGKVLVPWPNRLRDGRWNLDGRGQQLAITDPGYRTALHGLLTHTAYQLVAATASSITLSAPIPPQPGYPFHLDTEVRYELTTDGLTATHSIHNSGPACAPVAIGAHPFLAIGDVPAEELTLTVNGEDHIALDDRRTPVGVTAVQDTEWDLRRGRVVADLDLDDSWSVLRNSDGGSHHTLSAPDGRTVSLWADRNFGYLHVFITREFPVSNGVISAVAMEPMTAPANALRSGTGIRWLETGDTMTASWGIRYAAPAVRRPENWRSGC